MYTMIAIYPNTNDDWVNNSPFSGSSLTRDAFVVGTVASDNFTDTFQRVPGLLTNVGSVSRSIEILGRYSGISKQARKLSGVGGLAKTSDFTFKLQNTEHVVKPLRLMGRRVEVYVNINGDVLSTSGNTMIFKGSIEKVSPSQTSFDFTCRGDFQRMKEMELGVLSDTESDVYTSKILPITYGDFTDKSAYMPAVLSKKQTEVSELKIDSVKLKQLDSLYCYDVENHKEYKAAFDPNSWVNNDTNTVSTLKRSRLRWVSGSGSNITLWNPYVVAIEFLEDVSSLTVNNYPAQGSIYQDADGQGYEALELISNHIVLFTTFPNRNELINGSTLTLYSGTGPVSLSVVVSSGTMDPDFMVDGNEENYSSSDTTLISEKPRTQIIKVDNEYIRVLALRYLYISSPSMTYAYTTAWVDRGILGSTEASHEDGTLVYWADSSNSNVLHMEHEFYPVGVRSFHCIEQEGKYSEKLDPSYFTKDKSVEKLLVMSKNNWSVDNNSLQESDVFTVTLDNEDLINKGVLYAIDLEFPKVSLDSEISDIFLIGGFQVIAGENQFERAFLGFVKGEGNIPALTPMVNEEKNFIVHLPTRLGEGSSYGLGLANVRTSGFLLKKPLSEEATNIYFKKWDYLGNVNNRYPFLSPALSTHYGSTLLLSDFCNLGEAVRETCGFYNLFDKKAYSLRGHEIYSDHSALITSLSDLEKTRWLLVCGSTWEFYTKGGVTTWRILAPGLLIRFTVDPEQVRFWAKGMGRVFDPAISYFQGIAGELIENPAEIIEDILRREVGTTELDPDSFNATITERKEWKNSFSHYDDVITTERLLEPICKQNGLILSEKSDGSLRLTSLIPPSQWGSFTTVGDESFLLTNNNRPDYKDSYSEVSNLITEFTAYDQIIYPEGEVVFARVSTSESLGNVSSMLVEAQDIVRISQPATMEFNSIRDLSTVRKASNLICSYHTKCFREVELKCTIDNLNINVGDWIKVNSVVIPCLEDKVALVESVTIQPSCGRTEPWVKIKVLIWEYSSEEDSAIQEVPYTIASEPWQEQDTAVERIQEVDDA